MLQGRASKLIWNFAFIRYHGQKSDRKMQEVLKLERRAVKSSDMRYSYGRIYEVSLVTRYKVKIKYFGRILKYRKSQFCTKI